MHRIVVFFLFDLVIHDHANTDCTSCVVLFSLCSLGTEVAPRCGPHGKPVLLWTAGWKESKGGPELLLPLDVATLD